MVGALFDTNILIDYLNGIPRRASSLERYSSRAISIVSWMEVMIGVQPSVEPGTRDFLSSFMLVDINSMVAERAVALRRAHRMKLPDAIVWASAQTIGMLLVTRNTKDFPASDPGVRAPYIA